MYRTILFLGLVGAAAVAPIVWYSVGNDNGPSILDRLSKLMPTAHETNPTPEESLLSESLSGQIRDPAIASLLRPPMKPKSDVVVPVVTPIPDLIRFDITPNFVTQRWPRVSSGLPDLKYHGLRVPMLTGTAPQDLHGSASYFFNRSHRLERIALHGYTDDPEPLLQFVTSTYRLREYAANGQRLFLSYYKGQPLGMLRVQHTNFGKDSDFEVILEINTPVDGATLSANNLSYLTSLREANLL